MCTPMAKVLELGLVVTFYGRGPYTVEALATVQDETCRATLRVRRSRAHGGHDTPPAPSGTGRGRRAEDVCVSSAVPRALGNLPCVLALAVHVPVLSGFPGPHCSPCAPSQGSHGVAWAIAQRVAWTIA